MLEKLLILGENWLKETNWSFLTLFEAKKTLTPGPFYVN